MQWPRGGYLEKNRRDPEFSIKSPAPWQSFHKQPCLQNILGISANSESLISPTILESEARIPHRIRIEFVRLAGSIGRPLRSISSSRSSRENLVFRWRLSHT